MKLTVLIPYNRDRGWLQQAIDSVKNQSVPVDLILAHSDGTCADNLVKGLDQVNTEFYSVLAEDDWLHEDFAKRMLQKVDGSNGGFFGDFDLFYSDAYQVKSGGRVLCRGAYHGHNDLLKKSFIHGGAVMYKTESVRKVGGYDDTLETAEEYDLHLKMSHAGMQFAYVNFPLYFYRIHADNKSKITKANKAARKSYINEIRDRYR